MNIPPVKPLLPFNALTRKSKSSDDSSSDSDDPCDFSSDDINQLCNLLNEKTEQCKRTIDLEAKIAEYKETIHNMTIQNEQNPDFSNLDYEKMDLSAINEEIEKTKERIRTDEDNFQKQLLEIQKQKKATDDVVLFKRQGIALYNEIISWSQDILQAQFPDIKVQTLPPNPKDVYTNYSKNPDSMNEQIISYFKEIKRKIKNK